MSLSLVTDVQARATRHHEALDGLAALVAAAVETLTAAERDSHPGLLLRGVSALLAQQRDEAAALAERLEDAADREDAPPSR